MIRTIKTKQFKITAFVLALVLTVSCVLWNTTEVHAQELTIGNTNVQTFAGAGIIDDYNMLVGSEDNLATMGVFITGGSADKYNATNLKWTHNGLRWNGEGTVLFEGTGSSQEIYACSPYTENVTNDGYLTVTAADQIDWLVATSTALRTSDVSLMMKHALTKLVINPTFGTEVTDQAIAKIEVGGMYASGDLNISDNTWDLPSEANATLEMNDNYELLVIPIKCESFTVTVTMGDGRVFTTTVTCPQGGLASGTQYNITLQVGQDVVTLGGITAESWGAPVDGGELKTE